MFQGRKKNLVMRAQAYRLALALLAYDFAFMITGGGILCSKELLQYNGNELGARACLAPLCKLHKVQF
jgi:hypothetical protein